LANRAGELSSTPNKKQRPGRRTVLSEDCHGRFLALATADAQAEKRPGWTALPPRDERGSE
jgi:hypothetical protein